MKYSIIIPVHNSFCSMNRFLDTIENLAFRDFELIIIDDCSIEVEFMKLKSYLEHKNFAYHLIRKEKNVGPGLARNAGIKAAKADYVFFVDSDDYIAKDFFDVLNKVVVNNKYDLIIFDFYAVKKNRRTIQQGMYYGKQGKISAEHALLYMKNAPWGKIYRRECLKENVQFPDILLAEDWVFNFRYLQNCKDIFYLQAPLYYYVIHEKSLVNSRRKDEFFYEMKAFEIIENEIQENYKQFLPLLAGREVIYVKMKEMLTSHLPTKTIITEIKALELKYGSWYNKEYNKKLSIQIRFLLEAAKSKNKLTLWLVKKVI